MDSSHHAFENGYLDASDSPSSDNNQATSTYRVDMDESAGEVFLLTFQSPRSASALNAVNGNSGRSPAVTPCACHDTGLQASSATDSSGAAAAWPLFVKSGSSAQSALLNSGTFWNEAASLESDSRSTNPKKKQKQSLHLAVYSLAEQRMIGRPEFLAKHRLTSLQGNTYMALQTCPEREKPWKHQASSYHDDSSITSCVQAPLQIDSGEVLCRQSVTWQRFLLCCMHCAMTGKTALHSTASLLGRYSVAVFVYSHSLGIQRRCAFSDHKTLTETSVLCCFMVSLLNSHPALVSICLSAFNAQWTIAGSQVVALLCCHHSRHDTVTDTCSDFSSMMQSALVEHAKALRRPTSKFCNAAAKLL